MNPQVGSYRWKPEKRHGKGQGEWRRNVGELSTMRQHAVALAQAASQPVFAY